jgi:hypothetical protein
MLTSIAIGGGSSSSSFSVPTNFFYTLYAPLWTYSESNMRGVTEATSTTAMLVMPYGIGSGISGRVVCEIEFITDVGTPIIGLRTASGTIPANTTPLPNDARDYCFYQDGQKGNNSSASAYGSAWVAGDKIGVILDTDAATVSFAVNGTDQGVAFSSLTGSFFIAMKSTGAGGADFRVSTTLSYSYAGARQWR